MPQYREAKLQMLLELAELDPNLLFLAKVAGIENFGKILKSLPGMTFTIPDLGTLKAISGKVKDFRRSFDKMLKSDGKNSMLQYLATLGRLIDCRDVRTATREVVTQTVLSEYLKGLFEDGNEMLKWSVEEIEELPLDDKLKLYELSVKELGLKATIFEKLENLSKKKKSKSNNNNQ
jgi:hypothetical protein